MTIQDNTVVQPIPSAELIAEKERKWRLVLPADYRDFIMNYNGGVPNEKLFECNQHNYEIIRFLCILRNVQGSQEGWYDISVVESQIGERLTDNEDLVGVELLPIAELCAGDYACLDYREHVKNPCVCIWSHEQSGEFDPVTYKVSNTFAEFLEMLV